MGQLFKRFDDKNNKSIVKLMGGSTQRLTKVPTVDGSKEADSSSETPV